MQDYFKHISKFKPKRSSVQSNMINRMQRIVIILISIMRAPNIERVSRTNCTTFILVFDLPFLVLYFKLCGTKTACLHVNPIDMITLSSLQIHWGKSHLSNLNIYFDYYLFQR